MEYEARRWRYPDYDGALRLPRLLPRLEPPSGRVSAIASEEDLADKAEDFPANY